MNLEESILYIIYIYVFYTIHYSNPYNTLVLSGLMIFAIHHNGQLKQPHATDNTPLYDAIQVEYLIGYQRNDP